MYACYVVASEKLKGLPNVVIYCMVEERKLQSINDA